MRFINILKSNYLDEYIKLCYLEWGNQNKPLDIEVKKQKINDEQNIILAIALIDKELIGFISLLKNDSNEVNDLTPWYATMYVKKEYRKKGYSKLLHEKLLVESRKLKYKKIYLKTDLENYYEKYGAVFIKNINAKEKLYCIEVQLKTWK